MTVRLPNITFLVAFFI